MIIHYLCFLAYLTCIDNRVPLIFTLLKKSSLFLIEISYSQLTQQSNPAKN